MFRWFASVSSVLRGPYRWCCLSKVAAETCYRESPVENKQTNKQKRNWHILKSDPWVGFLNPGYLELVCVCVLVVWFCWRTNAFAKGWVFFAWINWLHWNKCRWLVFVHLCLIIKSRKSSANLSSLASNWDAAKARCCGWVGLIVSACPFFLFRRFLTHSSYFPPMLWEIGGTQSTPPHPSPNFAMQAIVAFLWQELTAPRGALTQVTSQEACFDTLTYPDDRQLLWKTDIFHGLAPYFA